MYTFYLNNNVKVEFNSTGQSHFFGYYNNIPWNKTGDKLLVHRTKSKNCLLQQTDMIEIGYFNLNTKSFIKLDETNACNWQQGSMLQWMPNNPDSEIIYNTTLNGQFKAIILNINNKSNRIINRPIYDIHPHGKYALCLNMERLFYTRRSYAYPSNIGKEWNEPIVKNDGLYLVNLQNNSSSLLVYTSDLEKINPVSSMKNSKHWIEHPMFNQSGNYLIFYHRWAKNRAFFTRLYSIDINGNNLYLYPDTGMYSHANWINDSEFIVFARVGGDIRYNNNSFIKKQFLNFSLPLYKRIKSFSFIKKMRKNFFKDNYLKFSVGKSSYSFIGEFLLREDGHPSKSPVNDDIILTDTYPDSRFFRHLYLYNINKKDLIEIGKFKAPPNHTPSSPDRCDLHPRWNNDGTKICIDSMHEGTRQVYIIDVSLLIN